MNKENRLVFKKPSLDEKMKDAWDDDVFKGKKIESKRKAQKKRKDHQSISDDLFKEYEKDEAIIKKYLDKTAKVSERIKALKKLMGKSKKFNYQGIIYLNKNGKIYYKFKGPKFYPVAKNLKALRSYHLFMNNPLKISQAKKELIKAKKTKDPRKIAKAKKELAKAKKELQKHMKNMEKLK